jgi:hypothetical protein
MPRSKNGKLAYKYFGPFKILKKVGEVAYQLDLPKKARIHSMFHVSLLKKWAGKGTIPEPKIPILEPKMNSQPEPAEILDRKSQILRRKTREEVLLRWEGQPKKDVVWVEEEWLKGSYPHFEGKVF